MGNRRKGAKGGKYYYTSGYADEEWLTRGVVKEIWLDVGGKMEINFIPPEKDDNPWNNDDGPKGPLAA